VRSARVVTSEFATRVQLTVAVKVESQIKLRHNLHESKQLHNKTFQHTTMTSEIRGTRCESREIFC